MPERLTQPDDPRLTDKVRARFWSRVDQSAGPDACWPWTGATVGAQGYGRAFLDDMARISAHRLSLIISGRSFTPEEPDALHSCDNPICVNPAHLRAGNKLANAMDMVERGRALTGDRAPFRRKPQACPRGEGHHRHILNEDQVREIREAYVPFIVTQRELAERYGVSGHAISGIIRGRNWKHVTDEPTYKPTKADIRVQKRREWKEKLARKTQPPRLTPDQVGLIRRFYANGKMTMLDLASIYRVKANTISDVVSGRSHKESEGPITPPAKRRKAA